MSFHVFFVGAQIALLFASGQCSHHQSTKARDLEVVYGWKTVDFVWPSESVRTAAIQSNAYIAKNVIILDVDVYDPLIHNPTCRTNPKSCTHLKKRTFVTTPRPNRSGIPATLSTVSEQKRDGQNLLQPFPNWALNKIGCDGGLNNVYRTAIDEIGRLWVLDAGLRNRSAKYSHGNYSPKILIYDLNNGDKLVGTYPVPHNLLESNTELITIVVGTRDSSGKAHAYLADYLGSKLFVFNLQEKAFHRISQKSFQPDPKYQDITIAGTKGHYPGGLFGLALGPVINNDRKLYYHSLASLKESYVPVSIVTDRATFLKNEHAHAESFSTFPYERTSQSGPEAFDKNGILFFTLLTQNAVACWNSKLDYNVKNTPVIAKNDVTLQFPSGLKVVGTEIYAVSSRFQKYVDGSLSPSEVNFRVLRGSIPQLIAGTVCGSGSQNPSYPSHDHKVPSHDHKGY